MFQWVGLGISTLSTELCAMRIGLALTIVLQFCTDDPVTLIEDGLRHDPKKKGMGKAEAPLLLEVKAKER